jgi:hypothetical protein
MAFAVGKAFLNKPKFVQLLEMLRKYLGLTVHIGRCYGFSGPEKIVRT